MLAAALLRRILGAGVAAVSASFVLALESVPGARVGSSFFSTLLRVGSVLLSLLRLVSASLSLLRLVSALLSLSEEEVSVEGFLASSSELFVSFSVKAGAGYFLSP